MSPRSPSGRPSARLFVHAVLGSALAPLPLLFFYGSREGPGAAEGAHQIVLPIDIDTLKVVGAEPYLPLALPADEPHDASRLLLLQDGWLLHRMDASVVCFSGLAHQQERGQMMFDELLLGTLKAICDVDGRSRSFRQRLLDR